MNKILQNIGVDIESPQRFKGLTKESPLIKKVFTKKEIDYCFNHANYYQRLATKYAAKEAIYKALSPTKLEYKNIEIISQKNKNPQANILASDINEQYDIVVSVSHTASQAIAVCMIEKKETT